MQTAGDFCSDCQSQLSPRSPPGWGFQPISQGDLSREPGDGLQGVREALQVPSGTSLHFPGSDPSLCPTEAPAGEAAALPQVPACLGRDVTLQGPQNPLQQLGCWRVPRGELSLKYQQSGGCCQGLAAP